MDQHLEQYEVVFSQTGNLQGPAISAIQSGQQQQSVPAIYTPAEWAEFQQRNPNISQALRVLSRKTESPLMRNKSNLLPQYRICSNSGKAKWTEILMDPYFH